MIKYRDPVTGKWEKLPYIPGNSGLPAVTPEMYGAKGDGKTDDTEAIQDAVDACGELGTVYFSNRIYRISRPIVASKKINIQGRQCVIQVVSDEVIEAAFDLQNQGDHHRTVLRDVTVECDGKAVNGFRIGSGGDSHTTQITVDNCCVQGATEDGFKVVPMAYCIRFQSCFAMNNGHSGISVVATDSDHQMNAVTIDGCSLLTNGRHGAHVSGVHIVVENCIIERNGIQHKDNAYSYVETRQVYDADLEKYVTVGVGSGVYVGVPGYPSQNIVVQNNYFEPNADAQITASAIYVSLRVLNNYFLSANNRIPEGHWITNVRCVHSGDNGSNVNLLYQNNTAAEGARALEEDITTGRMDVDGGKILDYFSQVNAQYVRNTQLTQLTYPPQGGTRYYIPLSLSSGTPQEKGTVNKSVNLVTDDVKNVAVVLPFPLCSGVLRRVGCHIETNGKTAVIRNHIMVKDAAGLQVKGTYYDYVLEESKDYYGNLVNNMGYYNIPNGHYVEVIFELKSAGDATSVVISNPYIDVS